MIETKNRPERCFQVISSIGVLLFLSLLSTLHADNRYGNGKINFRHISLEQGLSQTWVYDILEDKNGFMWFSTQDGLNKYDGYQFSVFRSDPEDPQSVSFNTMSRLLEDRDGTLWVGTQGGGLNRFLPTEEKFRCYRAQPGRENYLQSDMIWDIIQDREGYLWLATEGGLSRFDPRDESVITYSKAEGEQGLASNFVKCVHQDAAGFIWVGTQGVLSRLEPGTGRFEHFSANPHQDGALQGGNIGDVFSDHTGALWVATNGGLHLFDANKKTFNVYQTVDDDPHSLSNNRVNRIYEDRSGLLWIATGMGLNQFDRRSEQFIRYVQESGNPASLRSDFVQAVYESKSGILWLGTRGGISKFDREGPRFSSYRWDPQRSDGISVRSVFAVYKDSRDMLWISGDDGGLDRIDRSSSQLKVKNFRNVPGDATTMNGNQALTLLEDSRQRLWDLTRFSLNRLDRETDKFTRFLNEPGDIESLANDRFIDFCRSSDGTFWVLFSRNLDKFDPLTGKAVHYDFPLRDFNLINTLAPSNIYEDPHGMLWFGVRGRGFFEYNPKTKEMKNHRVLPDSDTSVGGGVAQAFFMDRAGMLWVGTYGSGLVRFNPADRSKAYFTVKDGMPNNVVYGILEDESYNLWLSTNSGLVRFSPGLGTFKNFTQQDGLQSDEFNSSAFFKASDGEMFFGGINGVSAFYPNLMRDNPYVPPVLITNFSISNQKVRPGSLLTQHISRTTEISLSYKNNDISFEFVALNYTIPEKNRYAYKLEGFDKEWIDTSADKRFATYTNLDPGNYVFRVKASNNDGVWNHTGASVKINIKPHFTRTWWFRILAGILLISIVVFIYNLRTRELSQQTRLKTELQTARDAQMSIMPQSDPNVPGFEISGICVPASEVGGDFFDYLWLDENKKRFGIAIGDVSGKSMKAAMTAVMSDGILYSKASESGSIHEIMTRVNRPLYLKTDKCMFTAMCLVSLDLETLELVFTNAGLSYPMLKSAGKVTLIKGEKPQFPLGVKKDNIYFEKTAVLQKGDVLLLFTDGIPETQDTSNGFYEYRRLKNLLEDLDTARLSASEIKQCIIADARKFAGSAMQYDDMTVVVVKVSTNQEFPSHHA